MIVPLSQYIHWADLNFERFLATDGSSAENIGISFYWFASEYVVIEGWRAISIQDDEIDSIIASNEPGIDLFRRARNAVFHFQERPWEERLVRFAHHFGQDDWLAKFHRATLRFLLEYAQKNYPYETRKDEFAETFFQIIGWKPKLYKIT